MKLKSAIEAEMLLSKSLGSGLALQYGAGFEMLKFDPAAEKENTQINLLGGVAWQF
ncbi:hypothetical protein D3C87_1556840 [compost metagenome]